MKTGGAGGQVARSLLTTEEVVMAGVASLPWWEVGGTLPNCSL